MIRTNELIFFRTFEDEVFEKMAGVVSFAEQNSTTDDEALKNIISDVYISVNSLVSIADSHGFSGNLWQGYLTYLLTTNENTFSIACEKRGDIGGSIKALAMHDLQIFFEAYHVDWKSIESRLDIHFLGMIHNFTGRLNNGHVYSKTMIARIARLSEALSEAENVECMYEALTDFYQEYGVGKFGLHRAFKIKSSEAAPEIGQITKTEQIELADIIGYEAQKQRLVDNTAAFVRGEKANNVLLFGDSGTGKSTSIKAILNEYYADGLRMIEVYKHQFKDISGIIAQVKDRNYKFIIYMDDLSFEEFEIEYKYLKAVIEGGLETKPDNVLIYATSNRRHLIRETWSDRKQTSDDVHGGDSMQEKLSLATRFGETIYYGAPDQKEYVYIAHELAKKYNVEMSQEDIAKEAVKWEMRHGGLSGRTAKQFIYHLLGTL